MHLREGEFEKAHTDFFEVPCFNQLHAVSNFNTLALSGTMPCTLELNKQSLQVLHFQAFKNYDESGSPRRTTCLKYLGELRAAYLRTLL